MTDIGVEPYREITFDADGDADPAQRAALATVEATDLVMFAHGWNNTPSNARDLFRAFYAPFPALLANAPGVRLGYSGVIWPSIRFTDETIPNFPHPAAATAGPGLDDATVAALKGAFPGQGPTSSTGSPRCCPNNPTTRRRSTSSGG